jgi:TPR repeat protein
MNWSYIGVEALQPLIWAICATLLGCALFAFFLHRGGGSSRLALGRFLRVLALLFPLAFLLASLWASRATLRGLAGVLRRRPEDQRAMGLLRLRGDAFLKARPEAAIDWFRKAALQGDTTSQLFLARALSSGIGTPKNQAEALGWAETAAGKGDPEAMILAGDLWQPRDAATATGWYRKAIEGLLPSLRARDPRSCLTFGLMNYLGKGVPADPVEGLAWMKVAEGSGLPGTQVFLVRMLETQVPHAQRQAAELRAKILLSPP